MSNKQCKLDYEKRSSLKQRVKMTRNNVLPIRIHTVYWFTTITPLSTLLQGVNIYRTSRSSNLIHIRAALRATQWIRISNLRSVNKVQIPRRKLRMLEVGSDGDWPHSRVAYHHVRAVRERHKSRDWRRQISIAVLGCLNLTKLWILDVNMSWDFMFIFSGTKAHRSEHLWVSLCTQLLFIIRS